jgi:hypothetical protein
MDAPKSKYFYYPAFTANRDLTAEMIFEYFNPNKSEVLPYICYHITDNNSPPILQIMLQKTPYCNNIIKEELVLPSIIFNRNSENIGDMILADVKRGLRGFNKNTNIYAVFKGILVVDNNCYGLVDLTSTYIKYCEITRNSPLWFGLPTEIVNLQSVYNISVSEKVVELFTYRKPELCILQNPETDEYYSAPDIGYTFNTNYKIAELQLVFGPTKEIIDENEDEDNDDNWGYIFNKCYDKCFKKDDKKDDKKTCNRYAIFSEDKNSIHSSNTVIIKQFEQFHPLSIYNC